MYKRLSILIVLFLQISQFASGQSIEGVDCYQEFDKIIVTYYLASPAITSLYYSTNGGKTFLGPLKHVKGDIGNKSKIGQNKITWNVLEEVTELVSDMCVFKVVANPSISNFNAWLDLVYVEGGTFSRGSDCGGKLEQPVGMVYVSSFYISKFEVCQRLWIDVMGYNPSSNIGLDLPVEGATWNEVQEFIQKLNSKTGMDYRLPTEAEWEYAARGGCQYASSITRFSRSADVQYGCSSPRAVNAGQCNEIGLYNMSGNVAEWCLDKYGWYEQSDSVIKNPIGDRELSFTRSIRGGSYNSKISECTVTWRSGRNSGQPFGVGFRLVIPVD